MRRWLGPRQRRDAVAGGRRLLARREARLHGAAPAPVAPLLRDGRPRARSRRSSCRSASRPVGDPVDVGGVRQQPVWLDFGDGQRRRLARAAWSAPRSTAEEAALAPRRRRGASDGLTPRERRGAGADRGGPVEPRHRRAPGHQREDRRPPRLEPLLPSSACTTGPRRRASPRASRGVGARMGRSPDGEAPRRAHSVGGDGRSGRPRHGRDVTCPGPTSRPTSARPSASSRASGRSVPDFLIESEWASFKAIELAETAIPNKYKELIGLAVSGATRCRYCAYFHAEAARLFGATEEEIAEAVAHGQAHDGLEHLPQHDAVRLRRVRGGVRPDHRVRALAGRPRPSRRARARHPHPRRGGDAGRHLAGAVGARGRRAHGARADARRRGRPGRGPAEHARAGARRLRRGVARLGREEAGSPG